MNLINKMFVIKCPDGQHAEMDWGCFASAELLNIVPATALFLLGIGLESRGTILPALISFAFSAFLVAWPFHFCQRCVHNQ